MNNRSPLYVDGKLNYDETVRRLKYWSTTKSSSGVAPAIRLIA